jgi:hypothetical protein
MSPLRCKILWDKGYGGSACSGRRIKEGNPRNRIASQTLLPRPRALELMDRHHCGFGGFSAELGSSKRRSGLTSGRSKRDFSARSALLCKGFPSPSGRREGVSRCQPALRFARLGTIRIRRPLAIKYAVVPPPEAFLSPSDLRLCEESCWQTRPGIQPGGLRH